MSNEELMGKADVEKAKHGEITMVNEQDGQDQDASTLVIDSDVVEKIVAITCRSIDGILQMKGNFISSIQEGFGGTDVTKGVQVEMVGDDACVVNVSIIMEYGKSAKKIFTELHDRITEKITDMTGLGVKAVNVRVVNVMTREEVEGGRRAEKSKSSHERDREKGREQADQADDQEQAEE